ncbi:MAG: PEP-CTERM sorting domain-containing protein [Planctomycetota bacterium]
MKLLGTLVCVMALTTTGAWGAMLEDFEPIAFSGGTVMVDPEDPENNALYVNGEVAVLDLAAPLEPGEGISMRVYDQGKSAMDNAEGTGPAEDSRPAGTKYGWNIGVSGDNNNWGVGLFNKSWLGANGGYAWCDGHDWPQTATSIWSAGWFGGPRQVDALSVIGTGSIADPEVDGDGAWSTWTWMLSADGSLTITGEAGERTTDPGVASNIDQVYVGSHSTDLGGLLIDDVQLIPEPATLSLLGLGGVLALIRRKR